MTDNVPLRRVVQVLGAVALSYVVLRILDTVIHFVAWRSNYQPALDVLRRYHKITDRPAALRKAAQEGKVTLGHNTGRRSGREYVTPVWGVRVGQTFFIHLPYGTNVDWCHNVLAAGRCSLDHECVRYDAVAPLLIPAAQARPHLPPATRRRPSLIGAGHRFRGDTQTPRHRIAPMTCRCARRCPARRVSRGGVRRVQASGS